MILVDTSVWIDHLAHGDSALSDQLERGQVLVHAFVIGELAMGNLRNRNSVLGSLQDLPRAVVADDDEVLRFVSDQKLSGLGIGYIDAHLLASVRLTADALLWTRDQRLLTVADQLRMAVRAEV